MFNDFILQAFSHDGPTKYKPYFGYTFGMGMSYHLVNSWSLQTEIQMESMQGQQYQTQAQEGTNANSNVSLHYTTIPLVLRHNNEENRHAHFSYLFGLNYAHLNGVGMRSSQINDINVVQNRVVKNELGIVAGLDYEIPLSQRLSMLMGGRTLVGMDASRIPFLFSGGNTYNMVFGFRVGLLMRVGKAIP
jgi:hypothetical protein